MTATMKPREGAEVGEQERTHGTLKGDFFRGGGGDDN